MSADELDRDHENGGDNRDDAAAHVRFVLKADKSVDVSLSPLRVDG
jgi:hypothetical protein